jgi:hypothetical protein
MEPKVMSLNVEPDLLSQSQKDSQDVQLMNFEPSKKMSEKEFAEQIPRILQRNFEVLERLQQALDRC